MMEPVLRDDDRGASPVEGRVVYDPPKLVWNLGMISAAVVFAPLTFTHMVKRLLALLKFTLDQTQRFQQSLLNPRRVSKPTP